MDPNFQGFQDLCANVVVMQHASNQDLVDIVDMAQQEKNQLNNQNK